ncbi:efflux RND transporter periplasmic adaptor subunit [Hymenobacter properus]|uniref:HlyD family efflux transporter periplasmic adaptor subunit n=1 Tax=Hymenobacter properus TaxID=2791026 RepID=A0A931BIJ1_9BACT|nr:HlyD family efflux transporter periplasmic adaptor subunit [Hymenobacter properus]MBF9144545.1 HlyD family efflux transporter periplasmic adaptor subunit [Hymenobacter properus]MBR7723363.1 HlyD family efflux transporter periplasmic adaptor subunit [Microvirga sp. SRT04]
MTQLPRLLFFAFLAGLVACGSKDPADAKADAPAADEEESTVKPRALVTVGTVQTDTLTDVLRLSAVSAFPAKDALRATTTGYVLAPTPVVGQQVRAGQTVFTIQTKESKTLHLDKLTGDPRLKFSGIIPIKSARSGILATVDKLAGDYVQDGEQLGLTYDKSRFGFVLDVPVTQLRYVHTGQSCRIFLPDGRVLSGRVAEVLPTADVSIQTQRYTIRPLGAVPDLPENLTVQVELDRTAPHLAKTLPRGAVLTDETQAEFWVMKLLNDSTAVKVPVTVGTQEKDHIEIKQPRFSSRDRILVSGNFGLDDTAAVKVTRPAAAEPE